MQEVVIAEIFDFVDRLDVSRVLQCISLVLGFLGLVITLWRGNRSQAKLYYNVLASRTVVDKSRYKNIIRCLKVNYRNETKKIDNIIDDKLFVTLIAFWNPSDKAIEKGHLEKPCLTFPENIDILDAMVVKQTRKEPIRAVATNIKNKVSIAYDCIGSGDAVIVKVVHLKSFDSNAVSFEGIYRPNNGDFFRKFNQMPVHWRWRDMMSYMFFSGNIEHKIFIPLTIVAVLTLVAAPVQAGISVLLLLATNIFFAGLVGALLWGNYTLFLCRLRQVPYELSDYVFTLECRQRGRAAHFADRICDYGTKTLTKLRGK